MARRLAHLPQAMSIHLPRRFAGHRHALESLLRTCQLILMLWLAFVGAQFAAKGVVLAGAMLAGLLN